LLKPTSDEQMFIQELNENRIRKVLFE
jgi:hypothetical protein